VKQYYRQRFKGARLNTLNEGANAIVLNSAHASETVVNKDQVITREVLNEIVFQDQGQLQAQYESNTVDMVVAASDDTEVLQGQPSVCSRLVRTKHPTDYWVVTGALLQIFSILYIKP